jgi:Domain of unknown function (DUF4234)
MAEDIQIQGSNELGKIRNPLGVIGLGFLTLGVYVIFWWYYVNKEMAEIGQARGTTECGDNPTNSVLALIPGGFVIVPPYISYYNGGKRLNAAERITGAEKGMEPGLLLVLFIFIGPVAWYIFQSNMNKVLQAQAGVAPQIPQAQAAPPPAAEQPVTEQQPPPPPQQ